MKFGNWYTTRGSNDYLTQEESREIATRYMNHDWGDTCESDSEMNNEALSTKDRIVSKYVVRGTPLFIITDPGHEITTIMLAGEY